MTMMMMMINCAFCSYGSITFSVQTTVISLNSINGLIFEMAKCCVPFEVCTKYVTSKTRFGFKGERYHPDLFLYGLQQPQSLCRNLIPGRPEYEVGVLTT
jgi:hypothetical protein